MVIDKTGMVANVGGNDWRIYTLHPEDCETLCKVEPSTVPPALALAARFTFAMLRGRPGQLAPK
jgi:hypothetical protein